MEIATLLSGGVDSSVVVHILKEQGYTPSLFYIKIGKDEDEELDCSSEEDIEICQNIAKKYGCPFEIIDLHKDYWDNVVAYTMDKVRHGFTPNPDVMCNKLIKFGAFEQRVGKYFDKTATGHYATNVEKDGKIWLATAKDPVKDQTDFLCQLSYDQLKKLIFPIGHLMKNEVRDLAEKAKLISAKRKDSQGICFLGKINYNDYIRRYLGEQEGKIVELETGKVLGTHKGFWFHTIGQRKGLGLSGGPWFVIKKDINRNIIYVSQGFDVDTQYGNEFKLQDFHFLTENPWRDDETHDVTFKIRHTPEFNKAILSHESDGVYKIKSESKIQGIAPGQFGTIYDADHHLCLASGEITL
jgi:tRNA (5-methylaminomethyl-2-thiouridylate)-methyltransferase